MKLTPGQINKFRKLYLKHFNKDLSLSDAEIEANKVLLLVSALMLSGKG